MLASQKIGQHSQIRLYIEFQIPENLKDLTAAGPPFPPWQCVPGARRSPFGGTLQVPVFPLFPVVSDPLTVTLALSLLLPSCFFHWCTFDYLTLLLATELTIGWPQTKQQSLQRIPLLLSKLLPPILTPLPSLQIQKVHAFLLLLSLPFLERKKCGNLTHTTLVIQYTLWGWGWKQPDV